MKREYEKPVMTIVSFKEDEELMAIIEGETGSSDLGDDVYWD